MFIFVFDVMRNGLTRIHFGALALKLLSCTTDQVTDLNFSVLHCKGDMEKKKF